MIEEIILRMPDAKVFSVLYISSDRIQVKPDSDSVKLCIFNTPFVFVWYMFN